MRIALAASLVALISLNAAASEGSTAKPGASADWTAKPIWTSAATPTPTPSTKVALAGLTPLPLPLPPTGVTPPATDPPSGEPAPADAPRLLHGELTHLGARELVNPSSRVGLRVGYQYADGYDYMVLTPGFDARWRKFTMGMAVPLRLELCRGDIPLGGCVDVDKRQLKPYEHRWRFDRSGWQGVEDLVSTIRYLGWGGEEDRIHAELSQLEPVTLGHGALLRRYFANAAPEARRLAADVDVEGEHTGFEAFANGLFRTSLLAVHGWARPLSFGEEEGLARTFTVGLTWARDLGAPVAPKAGVEPTGAHPEDAFDKRAVTALAIGAEAVVLRSEHWELAPFAELASLRGAGSGLATGLVARSALGERLGLRLLVEGRSFDANYLPGYFDELYEVEKVQYQAGPSGTVSKWQAVSSRRGSRRVGWNLEATATVARAISLSAGFEGAAAPASRNAYLHAEVPLLDWFRFFATVHRRGFEGEALFSGGALGRPTTVFFSGMRLKTLPFLFLNGTATQSYQWDAALGRYRNARSYDLDAEIAVEF